MRGRSVFVAGCAAAWLLAAAPAQAGFGARAEITSGPPAETEATTAEIAFKRNGPAAFTAFECKLDGGGWDECASPVRLSGLVGGKHAFAVRLVGPLADSTPDTHSWTVTVRSALLPPPLPPAVAPPPVAPNPPAPRKPRVRRDARGCAYAANRLGEVSALRLERATICVLNAVRRARGLRSVRSSGRLRRAAVGHARDMVRLRYFAHYSRTGRSATERIRATGYLRGADYWSIGEILAWLVTPAPTPARAVDAWMKSPPHRRIVVHRSFRDVGVGIAHGSPAYGRRAGGTWAAEFGRRG